jgi:transcriptional regulator with XRE-family HTH domain
MERRSSRHAWVVSALGEYLRTRRERLQPSDVGLPDRGRRRTPGLRREEVATLAGVSVDYLVRLEQGRDSHPSAGVLRSLADALQIPEAERAGLWKLAALSSSPELCPGQDATLPLELRPEVRSLLRHLEGVPAFVLDPAGFVLEANDVWRRLVRSSGLLDADPPNLARHVFLHPAARQVWPDWDHVAGQQVARLRLVELRWGHDEVFRGLMADLEASADFRERWTSLPPPELPHGEVRFDHPTTGRLRLTYEMLGTSGDLGQQVVTWVPADELSTERLATALGEPVAGQPARLRVVG